jgi:hypothetical protein
MGAALDRLRTMIGVWIFKHDEWASLDVHDMGYFIIGFPTSEEALKRAVLLFVKTYEHRKDKISFLTFETKKFAIIKCAVATIERWWLVS